MNDFDDGFRTGTMAEVDQGLVEVRRGLEDVQPVEAQRLEFARLELFGQGTQAGDELFLGLANEQAVFLH